VIFVAGKAVRVELAVGRRQAVDVQGGEAAARVVAALDLPQRDIAAGAARQAAGEDEVVAEHDGVGHAVVEVHVLQHDVGAGLEGDEVGIGFGHVEAAAHAPDAAVHLEPGDADIARAADVERHHRRNVGARHQAVAALGAALAVKIAVEDDPGAVAGDGEAVHADDVGVDGVAPVDRPERRRPVAGDIIGAGGKDIGAAAASVHMVGEAVEGLIIVGAAVADEAEALRHVDRALGGGRSGRRSEEARRRQPRHGAGGEEPGNEMASVHRSPHEARELSPS
jgi:hypothetical protein